jgi:hypothetical protein
MNHTRPDFYIFLTIKNHYLYNYCGYFNFKSIYFIPLVEYSLKIWQL